MSQVNLKNIIPSLKKQLTLTHESSEIKFSIHWVIINNITIVLT